MFHLLCKASLVSCVLACGVSHAGLKSLSDDDLSKTSGQTGVTIGLNLVLNKVDNNNEDDKDCSKAGQCQFGLQIDNQNDPNLWLTLTGLSGGIKLPKTTLESVDVTRGGNTQGALKVSFGNKEANKAVFTDFGFDSLRLSKNTTTAEGYRNSVAYGSDVDAGRQPGFVGMRINGPAEISGSMTIFNCGTCE